MPHKDPAQRKAYHASWYAAHRESQKTWRLAYNTTHRKENNARMVAYRAGHLEEERARNRAWRAANPEKVRSRESARYAANRELRKAYQRANYAANRDERTAWARRYWATHRDQRRAYSIAWRRANPQLMAQSQRNRRARKVGNGGRHTLQEWQEKCLLFANLCAYCGEAKPLHREHKIPLCRGGTNDINNVVPSCGSCNSKKGTMTAVEFLAIR